MSAWTRSSRLETTTSAHPQEQTPSPGRMPNGGACSTAGGEEASHHSQLPLYCIPSLSNPDWHRVPYYSRSRKADARIARLQTRS